MSGQKWNLSQVDYRERFDNFVTQQILNGRKVVVEFVDEKRTHAQQNALEVYCRELAQALNDAGLDMLCFPWKAGAEVPWDQASIKARLWKPLQLAVLGEASTAKLNTKQVNEIYEILDRHIASKTGIHIPFPSRENEQ